MKYGNITIHTELVVTALGNGLRSTQYLRIGIQGGPLFTIATEASRMTYGKNQVDERRQEEDEMRNRLVEGLAIALRGLMETDRG